MSTRSNIAIRLKDEDLNKTLISPTSEETVNTYSAAPYLQVYCHFDGYLNGVGKELLKYFKTYEDALNLVLGGNMSYINLGFPVYYVDKGEEWDINMPQQLKEPKLQEDYLYVFEDGKWYVNSFSNRDEDMKQLTNDLIKSEM